jgi:hypothetical protein
MLARLSVRALTTDTDVIITFSVHIDKTVGIVPSLANQLAEITVLIAVL